MTVHAKLFLTSLLVLFCMLEGRFTFADEPQTVDLVIVAGQSNAVGYDAKPSELPADASDEEVLFWWRTGDPPPDEHDSSSNHQWAHLQVQYLGDPIKPRRDRQYGNFAQADGGFGPEIGFAREWLKHNQRKLAIVKTAFSGTGLGKDWDPISDGESGACFRTMVSEIQAAVSAAKDKHLQLRPRAILWVQGESDANEIDAPLYAKRLQQMLAELRKQLNAPDLKALVAVNTRFQQGKNKFMPAIVQAQQDCAAADPLCRYVDTSESSIANAAHFDTAGTLMVGRLFAEYLLAFDDAAAAVHPVSP